MTTLDLSVIILTYNEEQHLVRSILSVRDIAANIYVIDCFSDDRTQEIAKSFGAQVYENRWINHSNQFNWALDILPISTQWILRLDADEVVSDELKQELKTRLQALSGDVSGIYIKRRMVFMDRWICHGDMYPVFMLRLFRTGLGRCEMRWMDEHIKISHGTTILFEHDIVDHNLNNLTWWTAKHNNYATREAVDLLNIRYNFVDYDEVTPDIWGSQAQRKRWLKIKYAHLPLFVRPLLYFVYRYFIKLGFMDGKEGLVYHFLQGFWYRFLVDAKMFEIRKKCGGDKDIIAAMLKNEYGIDISGI